MSIIIWIIKSRRMRWAGHVACMGEMGYIFRTSVRKLKGSDHVEWLRVYEIIILKRIITRQDGRKLTGYIWLKIVTSGGLS
jgi:hypothetical protein